MGTGRFGKNIRKVVQLKQDSNGNVTPVVIHQTGSRKKKSGGPLGIVEKVVRRASLAQRAMADSYLARHEKSNAKKRDGWLNELPTNVLRANEKGFKKLRVTRVISY